MLLSLLAMLGSTSTQSVEPFPVAIDSFAQKQLQDVVNQQSGTGGLPAVYAAASVNGRIVAVACAGRKTIDGEVKALVTDKLMIGSISKGVTATVIAALVSQGKLRWTQTVREALPDFSAKFGDHPALEATFVDLISHKSGLPNGDAHMHLAKPPPAWRRSYAESMFSKPMAARFRSQEGHYSAGSTVAAHMAERLLESSFEDISKKYLFSPMKMETFGWGKPWELDKTQPMPTKTFNGKLVHPGADWNVYIKNDPSGGMHCSIADLCRYATIHAEGESRNLPGISTSTIQAMHRTFGLTPGSGGGATGLGEYSQIYVDPQRRFAVVCVALLEPSEGGQAKVEAVLNQVKKLHYGQSGLIAADVVR